MPPRQARLWTSSALLILAMLAGWLGIPPDGPQGSGEELVEDLYDARRSGVVIEARGSVEKILADDREGSRHQRFIVRLGSGHTLLVAHNIDLAPRVEGLHRGDEVDLRGQYEWNERGGVVHWTHRDPDGDRPGGWIRHAGRTYR